MSYPYIYAETLKVVPKGYISFEQILQCVGTVILCAVLNRYSDRLFRYYGLFLWLEIAADTILFADVIIRNNLKFYFLLNVVIYAVITKNLICGGTKMRAVVHDSQALRERYDNNSNIVNSAASLLGAGISVLFQISITSLFVLAFAGNIIDNVFYLYIYSELKRSDRN
jgi:hypothetical protein